ncbi:MAG: prepilin-type N-terminal cleavage/methylation domain-containing protein [Planctomycetales bacterium]|nr:prepilin-type N-terminal cleavage/methylation domain-containing protein [Planctomycetales bacterium]
MTQTRTHHGFSLLEVIAALMVLGLFLAPTAELMRSVVQRNEIFRQRGELVPLVEGKQNELCQWVRDNFNEIETGIDSFESQGHPELLFESYCREDPSVGGVPGLLMAVRSLGWHDANGNRQLDSHETSVELWTNVARATPQSMYSPSKKSKLKSNKKTQSKPKKSKLDK